MGTVFGKNTTSSSITVAGHKVYYIDSTDAEIVEVEKTSGQALPSVGDTVTFGSYPQATSTPEPIEWTVLAVDSVNGKALLLSKYILDAHVYNSEKVSVSWATCTLRDWLNNTFYNAAFNSEEQSGIVTTHNEGSGLSSDDKVFCLTQDESTSYIPVEADRRAVATQKAIDDGTSAGSGYGYWWNLDWDVDSYYRVDMIAAGGSLSIANITVTWIGVRPAIWVSFSGVTTFKYNAFKYTISGTPYWYVIDGEHDTWTDDLSAWGYSEVPVGPVLPEVSSPYWLAPDTGDGTSTVQPNALQSCVESLSTHEKVAFNSSMSYGVNFWKNPDNTLGGHSEFSIANVNGYVGIKNVSNRAIAVYWVNYAVCSDSTATVVTVYNASNVAYNAFKFTTSGTDYYYVLDGTQTDWTDDLSSIGYHIQLPTVTLDAGWCSITPNHIWFPSDDTRQAFYWRGYWSSWFYDSSKAYAAWWWRSESESAYYGTVLSDNGDGYFGITNVLGRGISSYIESRYATCESPDAVAIQVLNSSNVAYAAFKYTRGGIDYYYVLDEIQTDWTDDLSSIGYSLYLTAYTTTTKDPTSIPGGTSGPLYNALGEYIILQGTPTFVRYYTSVSDTVGVYDTDLRLTNGFYGLTLHSDHASGTSITIQRIEYTVS